MHAQQTDSILTSINNIIVGKPTVTKLALTCLLARGHLLIEDLPGVGKTTLAHTLALVLGLDFQRIQFTSDMLPADIIGVSVYQRDNNKFQFHQGPLFSQLVLADEVNRATPRTQSALLEAMEERQVSVEGHRYSLPDPFFVIATQNPSHQIGTFPLPESQLDRFLMRLAIGYPDKEAERHLLTGENRQDLLKRQQAVVNCEQLRMLQLAANEIHIAPALIDYVQALLSYSRDSGKYHFGLSPRAGLGLIKAAKAWAMLEQHEYVLPEDIQAVFASVIGHRLQSREGETVETLTAQFLTQVAIPS